MVSTHFWSKQMSSQIKNQYTGVEVGKDERKTHEAGRRVDGTPEANSQPRATLSANNPRLGGPRYVICICERWPVSSKRGVH